MVGTRKIRIAILGGGVSGVVVAGELSQDPRFQVDLIERNSVLGGLHRSVVFDGLAFDIGPFLFPEKHTLFRTFPQIKQQMVRVSSTFQSLTSKFTIDNYPISIRGYTRDHGYWHCVRDLVSLAWSKWRYRSRNDLSGYVRYYLGSRLYKESGLKNYIERMYGIPDCDVALEFAQQRMGLIEDWASIRRILRRTLRRQKTIFNASPVTPHDLVRPREGFEQLYTEIHRELEARGVTVTTGETLLSIRRGFNEFELNFPSRTESYDEVVSTIPMESLVGFLGAEHSRELVQLKYVPLFSLFYRFRGEPGFTGTLLHNFTQVGMWKRITMFSAMYGLQAGEHYFVVDGTVHSQSSKDLNVLRKDFENHADQVGLLKGSLHYVGGLVTSHAYPLYQPNNLQRAQKIKQSLQAQGLYLTGRQGEFDYISSADAAASAYEVAQRLIAKS